MQVPVLDTRNSFAQQLFAPLPARYYRLAEILSFGQNGRWRRAMVDHLIEAPAGADCVVLDVAAGTAGVSLQIAARTGARVSSGVLDLYVAAGKCQRQIAIGDDAGSRGNDGRNCVDGGHRRHDVAEHHEVGDRLGLEIRRRQEADLGRYRWLPVDLDDPTVLVDLPVRLEGLPLAPPDIEVNQGFAADDALPADVGARDASRGYRPRPEVEIGCGLGELGHTTHLVELGAEHVRAQEPVSGMRAAGLLADHARGADDLYAAARGYASCAAVVRNQANQKDAEEGALACLTRAAALGFRDAGKLQEAREWTAELVRQLKSHDH